jgi:hypothetical protein
MASSACADAALANAPMLLVSLHSELKAVHFCIQPCLFSMRVL